MKRGLSIVLVLMLLVSLVPASALAAGDGYETITGSIMFNAGHDDMETDHPCPFMRFRPIHSILSRENSIHP